MGLNSPGQCITWCWSEHDGTVRTHTACYLFKPGSVCLDLGATRWTNLVVYGQSSIEKYVPSTASTTSIFSTCLPYARDVFGMVL